MHQCIWRWIERHRCAIWRASNSEGAVWHFEFECVARAQAVLGGVCRGHCLGLGAEGSKELIELGLFLALALLLVDAVHVAIGFERKRRVHYFLGHLNVLHLLLAHHNLVAQVKVNEHHRVIHRLLQERVLHAIKVNVEAAAFAAAKAEAVAVHLNRARRLAARHCRSQVHLGQARHAALHQCERRVLLDRLLVAALAHRRLERALRQLVIVNNALQSFLIANAK